MSFLYDRDQNVLGPIPTGLECTGSYGATVSFKSDLAGYTSVDNYIYSMPRGLNHLQITINLPFENRKEADAKKIVGFFESLQGTGHFLYVDPSQIYKPVNVFIENISTSFVENDLYTIEAGLSSDQISTLLNWDNPMITGGTNRGNWATATSYSKYDIVKYTGNATYPSNTGNLYDSFYYCTGAIASSAAIAAASTIPDSSKWSQEFFFQPTYQSQISKETSVIKTELPYSYTKRTNFGLHANALKSFKMDFKGISDAEARCILHFLIGRQGYRKFQYKFPRIYNQDKYFYCPEWTHTFVYKNVNDISVTLVEDPIGVRRVY